MTRARPVRPVAVRVEQVRRDEAVAVGHQVRLAAVEDRVVVDEEAGLRRLVHERDHRDPDSRAHERDGEQRDEEPAGIPARSG